MVENVMATIIAGVGIAIIIGLWTLAAKNSNAYHRLAMPLSYFIRALMVVVIGWTAGSLYTFNKIAAFIAPQDRFTTAIVEQTDIWTAAWMLGIGATALAYLLFLSFLPKILDSDTQNKAKAKPDELGHS